MTERLKTGQAQAGLTSNRKDTVRVDLKQDRQRIDRIETGEN